MEEGALASRPVVVRKCGRYGNAEMIFLAIPIAYIFLRLRLDRKENQRELSASSLLRFLAVMGSLSGSPYFPLFCNHQRST